MTATQVLESHPDQGVSFPDAAQVIQACLECVQACTACADACLNESDPGDLATCIRTDLDCADICAATATVLSRQTKADTAHIRSLVKACHEACATCATECERHDHEHCSACAAICQRCERICRNAVSSMAA